MVELKDGRRGIAYSRDQFKKAMLVKLINPDHSPLISEKTQKQAVVFADLRDVSVIGYVD